MQTVTFTVKCNMANEVDEGEVTVTCLATLAERCPNYESLSAYELFHNHNLESYLHNNSGEALYFHKYDQREYFLEGERIDGWGPNSPEKTSPDQLVDKAKRIYQSKEFDSKIDKILGE